MSFSCQFLHTIRWGLLTSLVLTLFVIAQYAAGFGSLLQNPEGQERRIRSIGLKLISISFLIMIGFPAAANVFLVRACSVEPNFTFFWVTGYGVILIANLWDLLVIDYLLLVRFKPKFMNIPDSPYHASLAPHLQAFFKGMIMAFFLSMISAGLALLVVG